MKRWISILLLAVMMIAPAAAWADEIRYAVVNNPDSTDRLNLRAQPSKESKSLGKYLNGTCVKVLEDQGEWARVQVGETCGYMMTAFLADALRTTVDTLTIPLRVAPRYTNVQALLTTDDRDMEAMVMLTEGAMVVVLGFTDEMAHVQYGGLTGYMPLSSLEGWHPELAVPQELQGGSSDMPVPESLEGTLVRALLMTGREEIELTDPAALTRLSALLSSTDDWGENQAGCIFGAHLMLEYADGRLNTIELATDGCCIYRHDGHDFRYAYDLWQKDEGTSGSVLFDLFGYSIGK